MKHLWRTCRPMLPNNPNQGGTHRDVPCPVLCPVVLPPPYPSRPSWVVGPVRPVTDSGFGFIFKRFWFSAPLVLTTAAGAPPNLSATG